MNTTDNNRIKNRIDTAKAYLDSADILGQKVIDLDPAPTMLRALALEIYIKALLIFDGKNSRISHELDKGWNKIDAAIREKILTDATSIMPGHVDFSDMPKILKDAKITFLQYRYDFEIYEDEEKYKKVYDFHPNEIQCLCEAIHAILTESILE